MQLQTAAPPCLPHSPGQRPLPHRCCQPEATCALLPASPLTPICSLTRFACLRSGAPSPSLAPLLPGSPGHFRTPLVKNRGSWGGPKGWFSALPGGRLREGQILLVFATCPGGWSPHLKIWGRSHEHSPVGPMPWSSPSARPASDFSPAAPGGSRPEPSVAPPFSVLITNLSCLFFLKSHCLVRRHELSDRGLGVALCSGSREKPVLQ